MEYPRYVHGPDGEHRLVSSDEERDAAVAEGYALTPFLTDEQKANVKAAQIAAGEIPADEEAVSEPVSEPVSDPASDEKPKGKRKYSGA